MVDLGHQQDDFLLVFTGRRGSVHSIISFRIPEPTAKLVRKAENRFFECEENIILSTIQTVRTVIICRLMATASLAPAALIGIDWGRTAPTNWNAGTDGRNPQVLNNLMDETGVITDVDMSYDGIAFSDTDVRHRFTPNSTQVPIHTNSLANLNGRVFDADGINITFSDLISGGRYRIWLFGAQFGSTFHNVTILGGGTPIDFTQNFSDADGELWVNGSIGSNAALDTFAIVAAASALGELQLNVNDDGGVTNTAPAVSLAGVAIELVPEPTALVLLVFAGLALVSHRRCGFIDS